MFAAVSGVSLRFKRAVRMRLRSQLRNDTRKMRVASVAQLHDCVRVQNENCSSALTFGVNGKEVLTIARWTESIFTVWRWPIVTVLFIAVSRSESSNTQGHAAIGPRWRKRYVFMDISSVNKIFTGLTKRLFLFFSCFLLFFLRSPLRSVGLQLTWAKTAKVLDFAYTLTADKFVYANANRPCIEHSSRLIFHIL